MIALLGGLRLLCGFAAVWFFPACSCGYLVLVYLVIVVGLCWWVCCVNCCGVDGCVGYCDCLWRDSGSVDADFRAWCLFFVVMFGFAGGFACSF